MTENSALHATSMHTERNRKVALAVYDLWAETGFPPSAREVAKRASYSLGRCQRLIDELVRDRVLLRADTLARSLRMADDITVGPDRQIYRVAKPHL